ncbi:MAG: helix-turn-helix transcriptional regulator [Clostridia bacterium]|nr:helix-turn-helix transcriptional regulator [Clostridia bacterium]
MSTQYESIGKRIKEYRTERNLSQERLGELISTTTDYVFKIESGRRIPSVETLVLIANVLEVSADDLLVDLIKYRPLTEKEDHDDFFQNCNMTERVFLTRALQFMKEQLKELGI